MKNHKENSVFILGDAYFNANKEILTGGIISLYNQGYRTFYSSNGCDFDREACSIIKSLKDTTLHLCNASNTTKIQQYINSVSTILTYISPLELRKRDDNDQIFTLGDFPISHIYNNRRSLNVKVINLFSSIHDVSLKPVS
ncbi:MAG: hypothetical protein R3Y38_06555 [Rikenellaceae bacterium]